MDLNNQNTTANTNTDSAAPDFGGPVDADKPSIDMDAINEAIAAEGGKDPNLQNTFDVGDISLDDVPQSQDELDKRMKADPEMNLAGGASDADTPTGAVDLTQNASAADPLAANADKEEAAPAATFVAGDIIDETEEQESSSTPETAAPSYDNINSDPLTNFETGASDSQVAQSLGAPAEPATADAAASPADAPAPAGEPAHIADTITMPAQKSKKPIFIAIGAALLVVVIVVLMILTASK